MPSLYCYLVTGESAGLGPSAIEMLQKPVLSVQKATKKKKKTMLVLLLLVKLIEFYELSLAY